MNARSHPCYPHAHGYFPADPELVDITNLNASQAWAAGELVSTADDLNRFYAGLLTGALLGSAELKQMLTITDNEHYGLGIERVLLPNGLVLWGHFGGIFGYITGSYHSTDASRQVTFSCTSTATEPDTGNLLAHIFTDEH